MDPDGSPEDLHTHKDDHGRAEWPRGLWRRPCSGAAHELNIQDLKDLRDAAASLKIGKNVAVQEACGNLDHQEGYGWLAADTLGVTLMHSRTLCRNTCRTVPTTKPKCRKRK